MPAFQAADARYFRHATMNSLEKRAVLILSLIYALRLIGMFMILPVFALYARALPGSVSSFQIGLAIGIYGLTQALLLIPLGIASDHWGRKPVIVAGMLVFALGSLIAGFADDILWTTIGRAVQGAGAVSSATTALLADLTRERVRTKAMALLGMGMGLSFILALALGPLVGGWIGVDGIFLMTAVLATATVPLVLYALPDAPRVAPAPRSLITSLRDSQLLRLNGGIFVLHACMTALFVAAPLAMEQTLGLPSAAHWKVYLPVLLLSVLPVFPLIRWAESAGYHRPIFLGAIALLALAMSIAAEGHARSVELIVAITLFFVAFNFLEGSLPSMVSRRAPASGKGAAMGVYASSQFLGGFTGGALGGYALGHWGIGGVFAVAAVLAGIWLLFAAAMEHARVGERALEAE